MNGPQILSVDLRMPEEVYKNEIQKYPNNNMTMEIEFKEMQMRKKGIEMLKTTITNVAKSASFSIVAERILSKGEIIFTPWNIKGMNDSFYLFQCSDDNIISTVDDPSIFFFTFFNDQCLSYKGTFAYINSGGYKRIIFNGKDKQVNGLALVDSDGNVYINNNVKYVPNDDIDTTFRIRTPIGEWIAANPNVKQACRNLQNVNDKMDYIGQYLIKSRLNDEIDQQEFTDIFFQAGIIGFKNPSIQRIYKLLT